MGSPPKTLQEIAEDISRDVGNKVCLFVRLFVCLFVCLSDSMRIHSPLKTFFEVVMLRFQN